MDHRPLVITLGKQWVADVPNKQLARIKEKLMPWRFNMIYNPDKTQSAADAISRCRSLLYVSIDHTVPTDSDEEFREFLEINLIETMLKMMDHIRRHIFRHGLQEVDGVLCYRDRIVVPTEDMLGGSAPQP